MKIVSKYHWVMEACFSDEEQMICAFVHKDYSIDAHIHDFYEINIVLSGEGTHRIEENAFSVRAGDVFVIPPHIVHAYENCRQMDVYHILMRPSFVDMHAQEGAKVKGYDLFMEIEPFLRNKHTKKHFLHLSSAQLESIKNDLDLIAHFPGAEHAQCEPLKNHTALKVIYWMASLLYQQLYSPDSVGSEDDQAIIEVLTFIHRNYAQKISVDMLCGLASMPRSTFMRRFRSVCHCSPIQYLMEYRRLQAQKCIDAGTGSRTRIAHECGFYDLSHMERCLKKQI